MCLKKCYAYFKISFCFMSNIVEISQAVLLWLTVRLSVCKSVCVCVRIFSCQSAMLAYVFYVFLKSSYLNFYSFSLNCTVDTVNCTFLLLLFCFKSFTIQYSVFERYLSNIGNNFKHVFQERKTLRGQQRTRFWRMERGGWKYRSFWQRIFNFLGRLTRRT